MAGDWIKIESALPNKPEVFQISEILGIDPDEVVGKLLRIWAWADQNSINGCGISVTFSQLDRIAFRNGFADAMKKSGWITGESGSFSFSNFERHNGKTAKLRGESARRMARSRAVNVNGCGNVAENPQQKAQPEKRREEKSTSKDKSLDVGASKSPSAVVVADREAWISELKADPAYQGIDVAREYLKMMRWCTTKRKQPTQRRFINWLNNTDVPLSMNAGASGSISQRTFTDTKL